MTGLFAEGDHLYVSSRSQNRAYRYTLPDIWGRTSTTAFGSGSRTRDIAGSPEGFIWVASGDEDMPIRCYDRTSRLVGHVDPSLVQDAAGIAVDDEGFVWVSERGSDMLLRIDVSR